MYIAAWIVVIKICNTAGIWPHKIPGNLHSLYFCLGNSVRIRRNKNHYEIGSNVCAPDPHSKSVFSRRKSITGKRRFLVK